MTTHLLPGDPAPTFFARTSQNPRYAFDTAAGRYLVLCFVPGAASAIAREAIAAALARGDLFNDDFASFFAITCLPEDDAASALPYRPPGIRAFYDTGGQIARAYGAFASDTEAMPLWVVIDPTLRVVEAVPLSPGQVAAAIDRLAALPPPGRYAGEELQAPILYLPRVFSPDLCRALMDYYDAGQRDLSGFMRNIDGKTVGAQDPRHKMRRDAVVEDEALIRATQAAVLRRVVPEILKVHQFRITRMERYLVGCYATEDNAHFAAHRDNTTPGTAHRRFAVSINLNDDFDGGEVSFPEYGRRSFKPAPGGAVVFSCSLLHAVSRVTRGRRYAFLPFLYDDAAAQIRQANMTTLATEPATGQPDGAPAPTP